MEKKEKYEAIGLRGFYHKILDEEEDGRVKESLDWYPYLKYLIQLCPGDWVRKVT